MLVSELVSFLQKEDQDLPVAFDMYSEQLLLETEYIRVKELGEARPDGWVHHSRPDKPSHLYLVFPGN